MPYNYKHDSVLLQHLKACLLNEAPCPVNLTFLQVVYKKEFEFELTRSNSWLRSKKICKYLRHHGYLFIHLQHCF